MSFWNNWNQPCLTNQLVKQVQFHLYDVSADTNLFSSKLTHTGQRWCVFESKRIIELYSFEDIIGQSVMSID